MSRWLTATPLLLVMMNTQALAPEDYAYGIRLDTDGSKPMYQLSLPQAVYQQIIHANMRDIQVFNADAESVPYSLRFPEQIGYEPSILPLPFYPVEVSVNAATQDNELQIEMDEQGRIRTITSSAQKGSATQTSYIIDVSDLDAHIETLRFDVTAGDDSFVQHFALDTGSDLNHWRTLQPRAALVRLRHGNEILERTSLTLGQQPAEYLRLRWLGNAAVSLRGITAVINDAVDTQAVDRHQWRTVAGDRNTGEDNVFYFDLEAHYPVDRINLQLPDTNTLARARFESRADKKGRWHLRGQQRVYRLLANGITLHNEDLIIDRQTDRYWRVTLNNAGTLNKSPQLRVGWLPQQLIFLARGGGPYVLAYGRANNSDATGSTQQLTQIQVPEQSLLVGEAEAGSPFPLGGQARLQVSHTPDWRQIMLWAILLLAVVSLAVMAMRLFRDINNRSAG